MSVSSQPKEELKNRIGLPLQISCPSHCVCQSNEPRTWYHIKCGAPRFITKYGDVICNCQVEFIKDVTFQCDKAKQSYTSYMFKGASQFIMAYAQSLMQVKVNLTDNDMISWMMCFNSEILKRWN